MKRLAFMAGALAGLVLAGGAQAAICERWGAPEQVGALDTTLINEASGIALSRSHANRLYHHNDSGDSGRFFVTDLAGGGTQVVNVAGFTPSDTEEMALGPCGGGQTCLFLGDIGDNFERRTEIRFVILAEKPTYADTETPLRTVVAKYPDKAHDTEAFAIAPNGDLYLITKPRDLVQRRALPAQIFRLTAAQLADTTGTPQVFTQVGEIDLPYLLYMNGLAGQLATGMDISPDGTRAVVITYQSAVEFSLDVLTSGAGGAARPSRAWAMNRDYRIIATRPLPQAEAITYAADGASVIYNTERVDAQYVATAPVPVDLGGAAPLMRQACLPAAPPAAPNPNP